MEALLEIKSVTKTYPGVVANKCVDIAIKKGEIHAILGENGAGKSTLVKIIYGLIQPDSGSMFFNGVSYIPDEPRFARNTGVAMVFQHFSLFEALTVAENVSLGMEHPPSATELSKNILKVSNEYGLPLDPNRLVGTLSAGERQRVEIVRCLLQNPSLLIMDEPTSVLTPQEVEILFETLRKLASQGTSILYISHKLEEIRELCNEATILRQGEVVASCKPSQKSARELAEMMVGSSLKIPARAKTSLGEPILEVIDLNLKATHQFGVSLRNIFLTLHKNEILGIGGVAGNGQDELLSVLSGENITPANTIKLNNLDIGNKSPNKRRAMGLLAAPEERLGHAAAPDMSLIENTFLTARVRKNLSKNGFISWRNTEIFAEKIIEKFDVRTPGANNVARSLSGGNLQKFVIGREILQMPDVLIVNQPTWGVDAAAAAAIRQSIMDLATNGAGIIVISQDLDELLEISDNFAALNSGKMSLPKPTKDLSMDEIGLMMAGNTNDAHSVFDHHNMVNNNAHS